MWFTGPRGRRGWPVSRDGVTIEPRRLQWIADGYRLCDGTLTVDVAPGDRRRWLEALRKFGWPLPHDT